MKGNKKKSSSALGVSAKRRRRSPQIVEEAILKAAEVATGLNMDGKFTLEQIAKVLEISPSTIYDHFRNKAALVAAVTQRLKKRQALL